MGGSSSSSRLSISYGKVRILALFCSSTGGGRLVLIVGRWYGGNATRFFFFLLDAMRSASRGRLDASCGWQTFVCSGGAPGLVLDEREPLVHLVHGHQLFLSASPMGSGDGREVDRFGTILLVLHPSVAGIVAETILDAHDDPACTTIHTWSVTNI